MAIRLTHHRYIQRAGELAVQIRRGSHYSAGLGIPTTCKVSRESRAIHNHIENQICQWAFGRKNWLFAGSLRSGKRAAALMSLI